MCDDFKYEPPQKILLEIFPTIDTFSVRSTGVRARRTTASASGRSSPPSRPRKGATMGTFNWSRVLKHEFTHSIN